jgi:hypothetical protein
VSLSNQKSRKRYTLILFYLELSLNVSPFIQAPENRRQQSTSYFPYIMYNTKKIRTYLDVQYGKNTASGCTIRKNNVRFLLYSYNFNPIKNTHLRHVTVHYFSVLYNRKPYFFRIGRPDKSVFFSYCTLCKGSNSLIFVVCFLELV